MTCDPENERTGSELKQRLLELCYGLLEAEESAELRQRIENEESVAQVMAEVERDRELLAEAAKLEAPPITLRRPKELDEAPTPAPPAPKITVIAKKPFRSKWSHRLNWSVGLAAGLLVAMSIGVFFSQKEEIASIEDRVGTAHHGHSQMVGSAHLTDLDELRDVGDPGQVALSAEGTRELLDMAEASQDPYLIALAAGSLLNIAGQLQNEEMLVAKIENASAPADDRKSVSRRMRAFPPTVPASSFGRQAGQTGGLGGGGFAEKDSEKSTSASRDSSRLTMRRENLLRSPMEKKERKVDERSKNFGKDDETRAMSLLARLAQLQANDGHLEAEQASITPSESPAPNTEVTALAALAWLQRPQYRPNAERAIEWMVNNRQGHFARNRSTQNSYRRDLPADDPNCPFSLTTRLRTDRIEVGGTVELHSELTNQSQENQPMTIVVLGLPAGLEPRVAGLEELRKSNRIAFYQTKPREVICYWSSLLPKQKIELKLELIAKIPGRYTGPPSRAYRYFDAESKRWARPLEIEITR